MEEHKNTFFKKLLIRYVKQRSKLLGVPIHAPYLRDRVSFKLHIKRQFINTLLILTGLFSAGLGLKGFLLPNNFIDGGVTGISLLVHEITDISLPLLIIIINIPFIIMGYTNIDKILAIKTALAISGLAIVLAFVPFPIVTSDKLLVAVFGGFFLGSGIGLAIRGGAVIDGTEILALSLSKRFSSTIGDVILVVNIIIFSFAAFILSFEVALYSILTYLAASKAVDYLISGIEEYTGVTIISAYNEEIRKMIINGLGRGVTIYKGKRGFAMNHEDQNDVDIVFTVITRLELSKLKAEIEKIDTTAFILTHSINDTKGGMIKKRPLSI